MLFMHIASFLQLARTLLLGPKIYIQLVMMHIQMKRPQMGMSFDGDGDIRRVEIGIKRVGDWY